MFSVQGHLLCLQCYTLLQRMVQANNRMFKERINFLYDQAEAVTGLTGVMPRYDLSDPVVHEGQMTFNNFNINQSVIGAINTGEAQRIDVSLSQISIAGDTALHDALAEFTQALIDSSELTSEAKNETLEMLAVIADEAAKPKEQRRRSVIKAVLPSIKTVVTTASSLVLLWDKLHPLLQTLVR